MNPIILWLCFEIKHFLADFPLQTEYMLGKFRPGKEFILPLAAHCAVHAAFTLGILLYFAPHYWALTFLDFGVHFIMDRIKASPKMLGRFDNISKHEWEEFSSKADCACGEAGCNKFMAYKLERKKSNTFFWWALGLDQMVHNLTYLSIVYIITRGH